MKAISALLLLFAMTSSAGTITIAGDPNAPMGNFGSPGTTATVGYTIDVGSNDSAFLVTMKTSDPNAIPFSNLYLNTRASLGGGSNLGFEFGPSSMRAFIPGQPGYYGISGTGITADFLTSAGTMEVDIAIPFSFFLEDPSGIGFTKTPPGTLVALRLSQTFSYSVAGGTGNYPAPNVLGSAVIPGSQIPEPTTWSFMLAGLAAAPVLRKFVRR